MRSYFHSLDYLRGIAAVAVCLFHFTDKLDYLALDDLVKKVFNFGHYGVEVFFIISGFVIPFSMSKGHYNWKQLPIFLKKRFIRIEPPYLVCVLLCLVLNYMTTLSPFYVGLPFSINLVQLISHIGYMNGLLGMDWLNPVFWTLAIEFQYYLLIALIFPLISHPKSSVWGVTLVIFNALSFYFDRNYVFNFSLYFSIGIIIYRYYWHALSVNGLLFWIFVLSSYCFYQYTYVEFIVSLLAIIFIILPLNPSGWGSFFGNLSYSLYLLHFPIGLRVISLTQRFVESELIRYTMVVVALAISVIAAYYYYLILEQPFKKISQNMSYTSKEPSPEVPL
ncbi:acyltransferase family protein [Dyadobacter tibetensis]|uniref:acyltransferase family protein n=1 Tax=Dyadobacter tibetensis TaxID=1211851 RepID=UPI000472AB48|nr:acyltransferase [Dyadobacter tibetensis]